ncbi:MAG: hypothetical protein IT537_27155 [Hyphomicrobiales bacterium]|nr:hypothetical protein [Hyphomicrobiales bacterium]
MERSDSPNGEKADFEGNDIWRMSIFVRGIGLFLILMAIAWNVFILVDAMNFDVGEHLTPACRAFQEIAGFDFIIFAFLAQLIIFLILIWFLRSWLFVILSVLPYWGFFFAHICTGGT